MSSIRPLVCVYSIDKCQIEDQVLMPSVFAAGIRHDLVKCVHRDMAKNKRQAYGVSADAGYQTSAQSWGTGRAAARIPRVRGGGTHRAGEAAFGNMCRGGGMFSPNKTWRRWHRKINLTQKRHAIVSAIAATAIPSLVMARGHRISNVPELPLVVGDKLQEIGKTKLAVQALAVLGGLEDLQKTISSKKIRKGRGKMRNRRYTMRKGPLIIYNEDSGICRAFRNLPGVDICHVDRLNLLRLAPGGTLGRFCVWSKSAFKRLSDIYSRFSATSLSKAPLKRGYHLPRQQLTNADISRIINSNEVQSVLRTKRLGIKKAKQNKNLLKNFNALCRVNPAAAHFKELACRKSIKGTPQYELVKSRRLSRLIKARKNRKRAKSYMNKILDSAGKNAIKFNEGKQI